MSPRKHGLRLQHTGNFDCVAYAGGFGAAFSSVAESGTLRDRGLPVDIKEKVDE